MILRKLTTNYKQYDKISNSGKREAYLKARRTKQNPYKTFQEKYYHNLSGFMLDCIDWGNDEPTFYQIECADLLMKNSRLSIRGPHGLGKTAFAAVTILWFALTRDGKDWKIPTTASVWRQLTKYLWPEIKKWSRRIKWEKIGRLPFDERTELLKQSLNLDTGEAFAVASNDHTAIEGAHADHILYLFDEAKAIPDATFDAAEGAFSTAGDDTDDKEALALAISTPGEPNGRFYHIQSRQAGYEDWTVRAVSLEECAKAGRVSMTWANNRMRQWGENSALYINRVLGNFAANDEDGVIPLGWVELAVERWHKINDSNAQWGNFHCVGVDVARFGADKTKLAMRYGNSIKEIREYNKADTMETSGYVSGILKKHGHYAIIDVIGIGAGVVDRVREQRLKVVAFNASERTNQKDRSGEMGFINKRSAAIWNMRERLDPSSGEEIALPPSDDLIGDLTTQTWRISSSGKIQVEAKAAIKIRTGRSPDDGDAVTMAFWEGDKKKIVRVGGR